jgi:hypothetical protein
LQQAIQYKLYFWQTTYYAINKDWYEGRSNGEIGFFPATYVRLLYDPAELPKKVEIQTLVERETTTKSNTASLDSQGTSNTLKTPPIDRNATGTSRLPTIERQTTNTTQNRDIQTSTSSKLDKQIQKLAEADSTFEDTEWSVVTGEDGVPYYWNSITQKTSWDPPFGFNKATDSNGGVYVLVTNSSWLRQITFPNHPDPPQKSY